MSKYKGIKTLEVLEGADNYNKWIAQRVKSYLNSPALEIGAGTGNISEWMTGLKSLTLTDIDNRLVNHLKKKFSGQKNITVEPLDVSAKFNSVKFKFKSLYSVNVLEHIEDEPRALENMNRLLEKKGKIVILVPAKKSAFTQLDKQLGHFRRYEKEELAEKMSKAGFTNLKIEYFNIIGLISWYLRDKIDGKNSNLKPSHVKAFDWIVPFLMKFEPKKGLPLGISLIAVGTKK
jgi:ubiquinone/menaquinone biosynthesis C-methylase UbiE